MATVDRMPWRPGADPLPILEVVAQAEAWHDNGKGNPMDSCRMVAFSYASHAGRVADSAILRMMHGASAGGPENGR